MQLCKKIGKQSIEEGHYWYVQSGCNGFQEEYALVVSLQEMVQFA